ncbi:MAG TPA: hypothetical protein VGP79_12140, partial [Bryobacteraceae bacterium]|nr:hypothetical protein [Bryobacteraceae bacterium]
MLRVKRRGPATALRQRVGMPRLVLALCLVALPVLGQNLPLTDGIDATAVDSNGFIYVAGRDFFGQLPVTPGALQPNRPANCPPSNCTPGYLAKVAPSGSLVWATYFYSTPFGMVTRIAVGKDGSVYVARSAPSNETLPTFGGFQSTPANIFLAKVSSDGKSILAGTYFGGDGDT